MVLRWWEVGTLSEEGRSLGARHGQGVGAYSLTYLDAMPEQLYPDIYSPP